MHFITHIFLSAFLIMVYVHEVMGITKGSMLGFNTGQNEPDQIFALTANTYGAAWVRLWEDEWAWQESPTDYTAFVTQAQLAKKYGLKVLAVCIGTPASKSGINDPNSDKYPPLPQYYNDFAQYCAGFVTNGADAVEVWNEPNNDGFWCPNTGGVNMTSSDTYADLLIATYPVIKSANSNAMVVSAGLSPGGYYNGTDAWDVIHAPLHYAERLFQVQGFSSSFDYFSVHPYMYGNGATPDNGIWGYNVWAQIPSYYQLLQDNGAGSKQLWFTEVGCPSQFYNETEASQAEIFSQYMAGLDNYHSSNPDMIGIAFIYELQDNSYYSSSAEGWFGIIRTDFSAKPSAQIVANWSAEQF